MWCNCPVQKHIGDKANGNSGDDELRAERRTPQIESFRNQIEEGYAD